MFYYMFVVFLIENKFYQNKDWDANAVAYTSSSSVIENKFYQNKDWDI